MNFFIILACYIWAYAIRFLAHWAIHGFTWTPFVPLRPTNNRHLTHPWIDPLIAVSFYNGYIVTPHFFPAYFIFFTALSLTVHTDTNHMLISRFACLYLIPLGWWLSYYGYTSISIQESLLTTAAAYIFLWIINKSFKLIKKHDGLGQGDIELLAFIGSFTGLLGCWFSILIGSTMGTIIGACYMLATRKKISIMPFGLFLAISAMIFTLYQQPLISLLAY